LNGSRETTELTPALILNILAVLLLGACASDAQRRAAEHAAIEKQTALEIDRICALPQPERDAELARIRVESGIIVQCGNE
jgi:outer membrane biogenesis lipoprotein LolB